MKAFTKELLQTPFTVSRGEKVHLYYDGSFSCGSADAPFTIRVKSRGELVLFSAFLSSQPLHVFISVILEERAACFFKSLFVRDECGALSGTIQVIHEGRESTSRVHIRGILGSNVSVSYRADIFLQKGSVGANTFVEERAIMLHHTAEVSMDPVLRINEQNVSAKHAATVSRMNDEELFYLASRGVEKSQARSLIGRGFVAPVVEAADEKLQKTVYEIISQKLESYAVS